MNRNKSSDAPLHIVSTVTNDLVTDQRMQRICSTLAQHGYRVTLVGRCLKHSPPILNQNFEQIRLNCWFTKGFLFYAEYNFRLMLWLLIHRFDIVNAVDLDTIAAAWWSARCKNKKVVYDAHEWFPECPEIVGRSLIHSFWQAMERFFVPRMDAVYTVSGGIAGILSSAYGREVALVRNMPLGINRKLAEQQAYILYQGALNVGRGLPELISAMKFIDRPLWIAGTGDIEAQLMEQVRKERLSSKVKFLGRLSPQDLSRVTALAWLGVNLLEDMGGSYYYSLANKFFDYVQAEVPQLCIDFPEYRQLCAQHPVAILLQDIRPEMIAIAIRNLDKDPEHYLQLQNACRDAAREWTWEQESINLLSVYEQLGR
jgi:glycosyltransferase involved in cell wall biosynthesis